MRVLVIDDAYDTLAVQLRQAGIEVIETGPSLVAMEGASLVFQHVNAANWILLDAQLGEDDNAGFKIASMMDDAVKAKTISITGETLAKRQFRTLGIKHTPGKRAADIVRCLFGECECGREVKREKVLQESTLDVLVLSRNGCLARSIVRVLSTLTIYRAVASSDVKGAIEVLTTRRPKVVLYNKDELGHGSIFGSIEHDYGHLLARNPDFLPLEQLYGFGVMMSPTGTGDTEATVREHKFINSARADFMPTLLVVLGELIGGADRKKEVELRAMPVFEDPSRDRLIEIARTMSPTSAKDEAMRITNEDEKTAQACRWLSILRRDFGPEEFERFVVMHSK
jgi:hypothetical protein